MRNDTGNSQFVTSLAASVIGSEAVGKTFPGNAIDTIGFSKIMLFMSAGVAYGTKGGAHEITFSWQESATAAGTDTAWSTINDGAISGTLVKKFNGLTGTTNLICGMFAENLADGKRQRYIRCHATIKSTGNAQIHVPLSAGAVLLRPINTVYKVQPTSVNTSSIEYQIGASYSTFAY